jgi:hypothetical protein
MPTNRTSRITPRRRITPQAVELFRTARALHDQGPRDPCETSDDPAIERLYYGFVAACSALDRALDRAPFDYDVFEALDRYRDTEITVAMIRETKGRAAFAQWGLRQAARDVGLELERLADLPPRAA